MSDADPLVLALPVFLVLCLIEALVLRKRRGPARYRLADFISGASCGMLDQVVNLTIYLGFLGVYAWVQSDLALATWSPERASTWVVIVLAHDLSYYCFHRASHRISVLWAAHLVHHQGEDYNFTVSLRQGTVATWVSFAFYLPLAFAGFPLITFVVVHGAYQVYQFFVHTNLIPRLGPLEWILATPRNHRVHHGRDERYLDRNYGGIFIFWDRAFRTFAREEGEPTIGALSGLSSWNPIWANLTGFAGLVRRSRRVKGLGEFVRLWFGPPEALLDAERAEGIQLPRADSVPRHDARCAPSLVAHVLVHFGILIAGSLALLINWEDLELLALTVASASIVLGLVTIAALNDGRSWALGAEIARLATLPLVTFILSESLAWSAATLVVSLAFVLGIWMMHRASSPRSQERSKDDRPPPPVQGAV
jgi:sterol desaturase/sphingolipid hydroxylase (fatty acid hydroxylase superfamily)